VSRYWSKGADIKSGSVHITEFERVFVKELQLQMPSDCVLVNSTWFSLPENVEDMKRWLSPMIDTDGPFHPKVLLYSGMDWENETCVDTARQAHLWLRKHFQVIDIGNTGKGHYFSFWMSFIHKHLDTFFDPCYTEIPRIRKYFMCLNHQPHAHRIQLLNLFHRIGWFRKAIISAVIPHEEYDFPNPVILKENRDPRIMEKAMPWEIVNENHLANDIISLGDPIYWNSHFCTVITESVLHSDVFLSEKTFKPMIGLRPFIIYGDVGINAKLKELGFDTFEDLFPLSHRTDFNIPSDRHMFIKDDLLNLMNKYTIEDLEELYHSLEDRLMHNRKRVLEVINENYTSITEISKL
jgi:hypothetical protein